jgi:hypothetical protein
MADPSTVLPRSMFTPIRIEDLLAGPSMARAFLCCHGEPDIEVPGVTAEEQKVNALAMLAQLKGARR